MLKNLTKKSTVSKNIEVADGFWQRTVGLIGKEGRTLTFHTRFGIHTFGMKSPMDVLILDDKMKVVSLKKNFKPNRIFLWNPRYKIVVETKNGAIDKSKTGLGDMLKIEL